MRTATGETLGLSAADRGLWGAVEFSQNAPSHSDATPAQASGDGQQPNRS